MPTCKVNGVEVEVPDGFNVIQAAEAAGYEIPYFCYHPGLSRPANCRMCVVDLGGGRLGPACYTPVRDGGEYNTESDQVKDFQKANLEFILLNHPVDCPICDQAGECDLQDLYYQWSRRPSRLKVPKVHKPKVVDLGPGIVLDAERCILCTRCIRVCDEVAHETQLGLVHRGNHTEVSAFPGKPLDNPYSLCTVDVCPVGALTSKDFRFKSRAWYLASTPSICPGCSTGCNVYVDHTDGVLRRLRPRYNGEVNDWWMCDGGRATYKHVQDGRILAPRGGKNGAQAQTSWTDALSMAADRLGKAQQAQADLAVVVSPWLTNEDLYAVARFASECLQTKAIYLGGRAPGKSDAILRSADKNPNMAGLKAIFGAFGLKPAGVNTLLDDLRDGRVAAVYQAGGQLPAGDDALREAMNDAGEHWNFVVQASNDCMTASEAHVVLPVCAWAEVDGTYTSKAGRVQRLKAAVPPKGSSRPHWAATALLAQQMGFDLGWSGPRAVFAELSDKVSAFSEISIDDVGPNGVNIHVRSTAPTPPAASAR